MGKGPGPGHDGVAIGAEGPDLNVGGGQMQRRAQHLVGVGRLVDDGPGALDVNAVLQARGPRQRRGIHRRLQLLLAHRVHAVVNGQGGAPQEHDHAEHGHDQDGTAAGTAPV